LKILIYTGPNVLRTPFIQHFEKQQTFDHAARMRTWKRNDEKWSKENKKTQNSVGYSEPEKVYRDDGEV
jgi:hypothetical protein